MFNDFEEDCTTHINRNITFAVTEKGKIIVFDFAEKTENMSAIEILNYYRNLYYAEPQVTERGIVANTINDVLNLINRQKEEIEKLKSKNKILSRNADNAFQEGLNERRELFEPEIKSEAYKEFAERLTSIGKQDGAYDLVSVFEIAKLLKEMVGKEK